MAEPSNGGMNALTRATNVLLRASQAEPPHSGQTALGVWARVFELSGDQYATQDEFLTEVTAHLVELRRTLYLGWESLRRTAFPADIYDAAMHSLLQGTSPTAIGHAWNNVSVHLTAQNVGVLRLCAAGVPVEERVVPADQLEEIAQLLNELEQHVAREDFPADLKSFFYDHISVLRRALREYPLRGIEAIRHGLYVSVGEWYVSGAGAASTDPAAVEATSLVKRLWAKVESVAAYAQTSQALLGNAGTIIRQITEGVESVRGLLPK